MKNEHPIDDLFRNKLSQYETPADDRLKKAFLANTIVKKEKKAIPLWYFSAAAAVLLAFSFFWISNSSENSASSSQMAANTPVVESPTIESPRILDEQKKGISSLKPQATEIEKVVEIKQHTKSVAKIALVKEVNVQATGLPFQDELIPDELTIALLSSEKKMQKVNEKTSSNNSLFQKEAGETIYIIASEFDQNEEQLMIQELNSDSPVTLAQATTLANQRLQEERSLIAKVFSEIKHLKHGEKVNLESFALAKNSEDTFIGNEIDELKEKWSRVKRRISK